MPGRLQDRVAIVTGGTSGIGRATCLSLAQAGAHVVAVGRNRDRLAQTLQLLGKTRTLGLALDVQAEADMQQMADQTLAAFGRIDILICAAGIVRPPESRLTTVAQTPLAEFEAVLNTNLRGMFLSNRAVLPAMMQQGGGDIINVGSTSGLSGIAFDGPYCASKFAVIGLGEALAEEVAPEGVRVQTLLPGPFETEMWHRTPSGLRPGKALPPGSRVADTIVFLLTLPEDTRLVNPIVQPLALSLGSSVMGGSGTGKVQRLTKTADADEPALSSSTRLQGKVVLVLGGTSGVGRAVCQTATRAGASVVVLEANHEGDYETIVQETQARYGRVDALVTAPQVDDFSGKTVVDTPVAEWEMVLMRELKQVYLANRAVIPTMTKQRAGTIVNVASTAGLKGQAQAGPNCAAQFGVVGLSQSLADEVRSFGIKVQTLFSAPLTEPHGGLLSPTHAADAVRYLLEQPPDTALPATLLAPLGARRRRGKPTAAERA